MTKTIAAWNSVALGAIIVLVCWWLFTDRADDIVAERQQPTAEAGGALPPNAMRLEDARGRLA